MGTTPLMNLAGLRCSCYSSRCSSGSCATRRVIRGLRNRQFDSPFKRVQQQVTCVDCLSKGLVLLQVLLQAEQASNWP
jgi:hypothetical protein